MPEIAIGEDRLHYFDEGEGPPVVMIHGSCGGGGQWKALAAMLAEAGYRAIRVDMLGMGASTPWPLERPWTPVDDRPVMDALFARIGAPAHLALHSAGGFYTWPFVDARRADILSLTMFEPVFSGLLKESGRPESAEFDNRVAGYIRFVEAGDMEGGLTQFTDRWAQRDGAWDTLPTAVKDMMRQGGPKLYHEVKAYPPRPFRADLEALDIPSLLLRGEHTTPAMAAICDLAGEILDAPPIVIEGAGHFAPFTHARAALPDVLAHLGAHDHG